MKVSIEIAIMSHLSDAQAFIEFGYNEKARQEINFVKAMFLKYHTSDMEVEETELDELWKKVQKRFGK